MNKIVFKKPGFYLDDPVSVVTAKPDYSTMGLKSVQDEKLSVAFERRLKKLDFYIKQYFETGYTGFLFPALFSCLSYVFFHHKDGRLYVKVSKTSVKK